jgi:hypothetical protein
VCSVLRGCARFCDLPDLLEGEGGRASWRCVELEGRRFPSVRGTPYAAYFVFAYFQHFAYCVFLTRITYCVLRIAYDCNFHIQPTLTLFAYCVLRIAYCALASPL